MFGLVEFLSAFSGWSVILIILAAFIVTYKIIDWCKKTWAKREEFKTEQYRKGAQKQHEIDVHEEEVLAEKKKIENLEKSIALLTELCAKQQTQIDLLIKSDELSIKAWIKEQHEKWIALQCIDSQSLELLTQRFEVYAQEGGNSWAEKLMEEIKALPVITVIPVTRNQEQ